MGELTLSSHENQFFTTKGEDGSCEKCLPGLQNNARNIVGSAMSAGGGDELFALRLERIGGIQNFRDFFLRRHAVETVAAQKDLRAGRRMQLVSVYAQLL